MRPIDADALIKWLDNYYDSEKFTVGHICNMVKDMPTIEPEPRWIPCSERLPEEDEHVLYKFGEESSDYVLVSMVFSWAPVKRAVKIGRYSYKSFCGEPRGWTVQNQYGKVVAWMPLPVPYREEGHQ